MTNKTVPNASELRQIDQDAVAIYNFWHDPGHGKSSFETICRAGEAESDRVSRHLKVGTKIAEERRSIFGEGYDNVYLSNVKFIFENKLKIGKWREHYKMGLVDPAQLRQKYRTYLGKRIKIKEGMLNFKKLYIQQLIKDNEGEAVDKKEICARAKNKVRELKTLTNRNIDLADKLYKSVVGKKKSAETKKVTLPKIGDADDLAENMFKRLKTVLDVAFDPEFTSVEDRNKVLHTVMTKFQLHVKDCEFGVNEECKLVKTLAKAKSELRQINRGLRADIKKLSIPTFVPTTPKRKKFAVNQ